MLIARSEELDQFIISSVCDRDVKQEWDSGRSPECFVQCNGVFIVDRILDCGRLSKIFYSVLRQPGQMLDFDRLKTIYDSF